jgi:hypothetical protein
MKKGARATGDAPRTALKIPKTGDDAPAKNRAAAESGSIGDEFGGEPGRKGRDRDWKMDRQMHPREVPIRLRDIQSAARTEGQRIA